MRAVAALFTASLLLASPALLAETLALPESPNGDQYSEEVELDSSQLGPAVATPRKGAGMKEVLRQYGEPVKRYKAVGGSSKRQPPITRWDYGQFYVFFENSHVVRAVVPGRPPKIQREDGLKRTNSVN